ncbi:hypothetical protein MFUL124B02_11660 [Myxococcus fulvus 124B02]|nr:hypothetical protein MFUL124B02_11660 [Myxococcus fulvus 124B02]
MPRSSARELDARGREGLLEAFEGAYWPRVAEAGFSLDMCWLRRMHAES